MAMALYFIRGVIAYWSLYISGMRIFEYGFSTFLFLWPWPWPDDLHIWTWPVFPGDIPDVQIWAFYVRALKSYRLSDKQTDWQTDKQPDRQTDTTEIIDHAASQLVKDNTVYDTVLVVNQAGYSSTFWTHVKCVHSVSHQIDFFSFAETSKRNCRNKDAPCSRLAWPAVTFACAVDGRDLVAGVGVVVVCRCSCSLDGDAAAAVVVVVVVVVVALLGGGDTGSDAGFGFRGLGFGVGAAIFLWYR